MNARANITATVNLPRARARVHVRKGEIRLSAVGNAIGYAMHSSRSHHTVVRVYDAAGNVIETHERTGEFREPNAA
jgi:hypothetical protein